MAINKNLFPAFIVFLCYAGVIFCKNDGPMIFLDGNQSISTPEGIGSPPTITTASLTSTSYSAGSPRYHADSPPNGLVPQRCSIDSILAVLGMWICICVVWSEKTLKYLSKFVRYTVGRKIQLLKIWYFLLMSEVDMEIKICFSFQLFFSNWYQINIRYH